MLLFNLKIKKLLKQLFFAGIYIIPFYSCGQENIFFTKTRICDTTIKYDNSIKVELNNLQGKDHIEDQVIYFTNVETFREYLKKNKIVNVLDSKSFIKKINSNKYNVVFIKIGTSCGTGLSQKNFKISNEQDKYIIYLNFILKRQENSILYTYYRSLLLPKGKKNIPELQILETLEKCY